MASEGPATIIPFAMPCMTNSKRRSRRKPFRVGRSKTGLGLFAVEPIKKGTFIIEYWGRRIPTKITDELETKYLFEINSRWTVDGSTRRNIARYINHSCRPNAESDIKKGAILISAIKNIKPGDEITYNYGKGYFDTFIKPKGCKCSSCLEKRRLASAGIKRVQKVRRAKRSKKGAPGKPAAAAKTRRS